MDERIGPRLSKKTLPFLSPRRGDYCVRIRRSFDSDDFTLGYNFLERIPSSACSANVTEQQPSKNYLGKFFFVCLFCFCFFVFFFPLSTNLSKNRVVWQKKTLTKKA